jgi:hypothetical protein
MDSWCDVRVQDLKVPKVTDLAVRQCAKPFDAPQSKVHLACLPHLFLLLAYHAALAQSKARGLLANEACVRDVDSRALQRVESWF